MNKISNLLANNGEGGFTLLEVLISTVILAIGLLGVAALQLTAISGNAFGHKLNEATQRIETKIEQYRNMPFEDLATEDPATDGDGYTLSSVVTDGPAPVENQTKVVVVTAEWTDNTTSKNHQISVRTIISD